VNGTPVILDERGLRTNNAGIGLDLIVLISTCRPGLPPDDVSEVRARLTSSFLEIHLGYRFNQLLFEATDKAEVDYTVSTHVYRLADDFVEFHRLNPSTPWNRDRGLFVINRSDALGATGSIASLLFEMRAPRLHLRTSDQTLAGAALQAGRIQSLRWRSESRWPPSRSDGLRSTNGSDALNPPCSRTLRPTGTSRHVARRNGIGSSLTSVSTPRS
jgi:hypothetical protein